MKNDINLSDFDAVLKQYHELVHMKVHQKMTA
jgi:hypothetical protein